MARYEAEGEAMSQSGVEAEAAGRALARQVLAFLVIGALGFCLDAALTISLVQGLGAPPLLARLPAFAVVTLINFALNRAFTFRAGRTPWLGALARYVLVCLAGIALNYAVYATCLALAGALGVAPSAAILALFIAGGTGAAALLTFIGFRSFAFAPQA
jgi:putative flippase GtrA